MTRLKKGLPGCAAFDPDWHPCHTTVHGLQKMYTVHALSPRRHFVRTLRERAVSGTVKRQRGGLHRKELRVRKWRALCARAWSNVVFTDDCREGEAMKLSVRGIPSDEARRLQSGGTDANGQSPLRRIAAGSANPCRHCLQLIAEGDEKLVLSYRPFSELQPYAEVGPIFLHAHDCTRFESERLPMWFAYLEPAIVRGYGYDNWIKYETGAVVSGKDLTDRCTSILADAEIAYVHIRSRFNCFQCRVDRADEFQRQTEPICAAVAAGKPTQRTP